MSGLRHLFLPVVAILVLVVAGCTTQGSVVSFNDALVTPTQEIEKHALEFGTMVGMYAQGEKVDLQKAQGYYDQIEQIVVQAQKDLDTISIPDDPTCVEFHKEMKVYMAYQKQVVETDFKKLLDAMKRANPADDAAVQMVNEWVDSTDPKEDELITRVGNAQAKMASKFRIMIEE